MMGRGMNNGEERVLLKDNDERPQHMYHIARFAVGDNEKIVEQEVQTDVRA